MEAGGLLPLAPEHCLVPEPVHFLIRVLFLSIDKHFSLKPMDVMLYFMEVERTSQQRTDPGNYTSHRPLRGHTVLVETH